MGFAQPSATLAHRPNKRIEPETLLNHATQQIDRSGAGFEQQIASFCCIQKNTLNKQLALNRRNHEATVTVKRP